MNAKQFDMPEMEIFLGPGHFVVGPSYYIRHPSSQTVQDRILQFKEYTYTYVSRVMIAEVLANNEFSQQTSIFKNELNIVVRAVGPRLTNPSSLELTCKSR